jgi:hypothetical protein
MKMHSIEGVNDPESSHVAFASNLIFWISYSCLECASVAALHENQDLASELQVVGMQTITKILEKSEIHKLIIGVQKLSPNFYQYSIAHL